MYKRNKKEKRNIEEIINDLYKQKDDNKLYGNYNIKQIYNYNLEKITKKFNNSVVLKLV